MATHVGVSPGLPRPSLGSAPPSRQPGFSRGERWFFFVCLALVAVWGFAGVDLSGLKEPPLRPAPILVAAPPSGDVGDVSAGKAAFEANGCGACHSVDGSSRIGPSLAGIWGEAQPLTDGTTASVDEGYVHESIMSPQARVVRGYEDAAMPSYEGLVSPADLDALTDYIRSLR